jgi:hypothetical protein
MTDYSLEKRDVKSLFLSVMNGGKRDGILDPFFIKFKIECERIHAFIASLNPNLLKVVCKRKDFNVNGSLTNIISFSLENEILLHSVQYLMNDGYNVDVLVFYGCMIRRNENKDIHDESLSGLSEYILEKTGYDIKFVGKKLNTSIDLSIYETPNNDIEASITHHKIKKNLKRHILKSSIHPFILA